jgi:hypothetical protein
VCIELRAALPLGFCAVGGALLLIPWKVPRGVTWPPIHPLARHPDHSRQYWGCEKLVHIRAARERKHRFVGQRTLFERSVITHSALLLSRAAMQDYTSVLLATAAANVSAHHTEAAGLARTKRRRHCESSAAEPWPQPFGLFSALCSLYWGILRFLGLSAVLGVVKRGLPSVWGAGGTLPLKRRKSIFCAALCQITRADVQILLAQAAILQILNSISLRSFITWFELEMLCLQLKS